MKLCGNFRLCRYAFFRPQIRSDFLLNISKLFVNWNWALCLKKLIYNLDLTGCLLSYCTVHLVPPVSSQHLNPVQNIRYKSENWSERGHSAWRLWGNFSQLAAVISKVTIFRRQETRLQVVYANSVHFRVFLKLKFSVVMRNCTEMSEALKVFEHACKP